MTRLFLILTLICVALNSYAQKRQYGGSWCEELYGNIASITQTDSTVNEPYLIECGGVPRRNVSYISSLFDDKGNQLSCNFYDLDSNLSKRIVSDYDQQNKRTASVCRDGNSKLVWKNVYRYNATGDLTATIVYDSAGSITDTLHVQYRSKERNYFDQEGKTTNTLIYWGNDTSGSIPCGVNNRADNRVNYTAMPIAYDSGGRKIMATSYKQYGEVWLTKRVFDKHGNEVEADTCTSGMIGRSRFKAKEYDSIGNLLVCTETIKYGQKTDSKNVYKYAKNAHVIDCTSYMWVDKYILDNRMIYDSEGREIEHTYYHENEVSRKYIKTYDAHGNLLHDILFTANGALVHETFYRYYQFDTHGNWHKKATWSWDANEPANNVPAVTYRDIAYYE